MFPRSPSRFLPLLAGANEPAALVRPDAKPAAEPDRGPHSVPDRVSDRVSDRPSHGFPNLLADACPDHLCANRFADRQPDAEPEHVRPNRGPDHLRPDHCPDGVSDRLADAHRLADHHPDELEPN